MQDSKAGQTAFLQEFTEEYPKELTEQYELLECFSHKEGCETFLAKERGSGKRVVAKCYYREHPLFEETEPVQLQGIQFAGIPAYVGEYRNAVMRCILREYVEGFSLWECVGGGFPTDFICIVGIKLCEILGYLHGQKPPVIHRDIKPQNVIIQKDGGVALIDFGISRLYKEEETSDTLPCGTRDFAPPEQYGFGQTDRRSDVYSLGMLLTWMLTGEAKRIEAPASPLGKILKRCTAFAPKDRYDSAKEVAAQLEKLSPDVRKRRRRRSCIAGAALLFCLAAVLSAWLQQRKNGVAFREPLIEEAVRAELGLPSGAITREDLLEVTELYIHGDKITTNIEDYYSSVDDWFVEGMLYGDVASLEDLADMPNLTTVCIGGEKISDLSPLETLGQLERVEFWYNDISEVSALAGKEHLYQIGLGNNPLTDISGLEECPAIRSLVLGNAGSFDGKPLEGLDELDLLDITSDTDAWRYLSGKSITVLKVGGPELTDLSCIRDMKRVEELYIYWSVITDISGLEGREDIRYLDISGSLPEDLSPVFTLPNLETVVVSVEVQEDMEELLNAYDDEISFVVEYAE